MSSNKRKQTTDRDDDDDNNKLYVNIFDNMKFYLVLKSILRRLPPCDGSVCLCNQTKEHYVRTDGQKVYLQDQTSRTPPIVNKTLQTTPPGTPPTSQASYI